MTFEKSIEHFCLSDCTKSHPLHGCNGCTLMDYKEYLLTRPEWRVVLMEQYDGVWKEAEG